MPDEIDVNANVPIVGQAGQLLFWYPTTLMKCNCDPTKLLLIIVTGFGNASGCGNCGRLYIARGLQVDGKGKVQMVVDTIASTPKGAVQ